MKSAPSTPAEREKSAIATIEEAFSLAPTSWRPARIKPKTDTAGAYLEIAFLTPALGARQARTLQTMADTTGHRLHIRPHANTFDLIETAKHLVPPRGAY